MSSRDILALYLERLREAIEHERGNDVKFSFVLVELPFLLLTVIGFLILAAIIVVLLASALVGAHYSISGGHSLQGAEWAGGGGEQLAVVVGLLMLIAWPLTLMLGIWSAYAVYKLVAREVDHRKRVSKVYQILYDMLGKLGVDEARLVSLRDKIEEVKSLIPEHSPGLWAILSYFISILLFYIFHFLNKELVKHEAVERRIYEILYEYLSERGVAIGRPAILEEPPTPDRSTILYIVVSIFTLGLFFPYWVHVVNQDWNRHVEIHERSERWLLQSLEKLVTSVA